MNSSESYFVHPSSYIDPPCFIGSGTRIWHFCHIMPHVRIGQECVLGQNVFVASEVVIGNRVKIQNNVSLYKGVCIEDDVFLGPSCVFTNVKNPRAELDRRSQFMQTLVKKGATIGANATLICGVTIGSYAMIGAGSVITHDVPAYALIMGVPARQVGWVGIHGVQLVEADQEGVWLCPQSGLNYVFDERLPILFRGLRRLQ